MKHNTYYGQIQEGRHIVCVIEEGKSPMPLSIGRAVEAGFRFFNNVAWGHMGRGSMQLAAAILLEEAGDGKDPSLIREYVEPFCREVIAALPHDRGFTLTSDSIREWTDERPVVAR